MPDYISIDQVYEMQHIGVGHLDGGHSGRYPWGSGENPYQSDKSEWAKINLQLIKDGLSEDERAEAFQMTLPEYRSRYAMTMDAYYKSQGLSEKERADKFGLSINELRQTIAISASEEKLYNIAWVTKLRNTGMSLDAISEETKIPKSTVADLLKPGAEEKANKINTVADALKKELETNTYIQVGSGVESYFGVSRTKMDNALYNLKQQGYVVTTVQVQQQSRPGKEASKTSVKVLAPPGTTYVDVKKNIDQINLPFATAINEDTKDIDIIQPPQSLSSSRIKIKYADEGGIEKDGIIELRRGVADLSLGDSNYAQVRIKVDNDLYLKGMAMYSDDLPDGVDVVFNSNKASGTPLNKVLKEIPLDPTTGKPSDNPAAYFGATIKAKGQVPIKDKNGNYIYNDDGSVKIGCINKINEEGDWDEWSRTIASQMLSKQSVPLAKRQLDLSYKQQDLEFKKIMDLDNPVVKKNLLDSLADDCDSKAVNLKAAAMPGQRAQVLLPLNSLKENEIYAPNFPNGERVVLIRFPHGGKFEIPELIVNNNNTKGKEIIGNAIDAVGINQQTAKKLSGADFDGDTALVIPNPKGEIKTARTMPGLQDFDPNEYALPDDYKGNLLMPKERKGYYMGVASNLITDMTLQKASEDELERAVKYSMVVIDAPKHKLNYKQAQKDFRIKDLQNKYQKHPNDDGSGGASTLISKAKSTTTIEKRKPGGYLYDENGEVIKNSLGKPKVFTVNPKTGEKLYRPANETYTEYKVGPPGKSGKWMTYTQWQKENPNYEIKETRQKTRTVSSTKMAEAKDAYELSSGTKMESVYADYANKMKSLANECRKQSYAIPTTEKVNKEAKTQYSKEVASLDEKINTAKRNEPLERQANIIASTNVQMRISSDDTLDSDRIGRLQAQELARARNQVGAKGSQSKIKITDSEWEAIQNNAVSTNKQKEIIRYADKDRLRELATPKTQSKTVSASEKSLIKSMLAAGSTQEEVAKALGISVSTVNTYSNE